MNDGLNNFADQTGEIALMEAVRKTLQFFHVNGERGGIGDGIFDFFFNFLGFKKIPGIIFGNVFGRMGIGYGRRGDLLWSLS